MRWKERVIRQICYEGFRDGHRKIIYSTGIGLGEGKEKSIEGVGGTERDEGGKRKEDGDRRGEGRGEG